MHTGRIVLDPSGRANLDVPLTAHPDLIAELKGNYLGRGERLGVDFVLYLAKDTTKGTAGRRPLHASGESPDKIRKLSRSLRLTIANRANHAYRNGQQVSFTFVHPHLTIFTEN